MKYIVAFFLFISIFALSAQACEGDCVVCHPNLVKEDGKLDKEHEVLVTCKTCHTQEDMEKIDMGSGCGQDCWDCHDIKKVTASKVKEHNGLQKCIDCHVTIDKTILGGATTPSFSELPTLDELMGGNIGSDVVEVDEASVVEEINKTVKSSEEKSEVQVSKNAEPSSVSFWEKVSRFFKNIWQTISSIFA